MMCEKVLLIAPHEDDEILIGNKLLLKMTSNELYNIHVAFITNGDFYSHEKEIRMNESLQGLRTIGITDKNVFFLGYKDSLVIDGKHFYNSNEQGEEYYTSGLEVNSEFCFCRFGEHHTQNRNNVKGDLKACICDIMPSVLVSVDIDSHPDHKMTSILFDEIMGEIIKENKNYQPLVIKRFAYDGSLFGARDYFTSDNRMNLTKEYKHYHLTDDRVEFDTCGIQKYNIFKEPLFDVMKNYESQNMAVKADRYINDSVVAYLKRSDNLALNAEVNASSGCAVFVNDFKTYDSVNILKNDDSDVYCSWVPNQNDNENRLTMSLDDHKLIRKIVIYKNPVEDCELNGIVIKADTGEEYVIDEFERDTYSKSVEVEISPECKIITFHIDSPDGKHNGISEIEIFENYYFESDILKKLTISDGMESERGYPLRRCFFKIAFSIYSFLGRQIPGRYDYMRYYGDLVNPSKGELFAFQISSLLSRFINKICKKSGI